MSTVNATYESHYAKCKQKYPFDVVDDLYSVSMVRNPVAISSDVLNSVATDVSVSLQEGRLITENEFASYTSSLTSIERLEDLCQEVFPQLEKQFFGSYIKVERIHILQNKPDAPKASSWLWHYDNCPKQFLKFAVYLNDVDELSGPMEYVRGNGYVPVIPTHRISPVKQGQILYPGSRIPQSLVEDIVSNGGKIEPLTGPAGTNFLFTPNIMHRGTAPLGTNYRQAIFFFIRPSLNKIVNYTASAVPKNHPGDVKVYRLD